MSTPKFIDKKPNNVIDAVVDHDICIGCGVCAGVCPYGYLEMRWSPQGELTPVITGCSPTCDLCLRVCPFCDHDEDHDDIACELFASIPQIEHISEAGYYLNAYVGYSADEIQRARGASGGLASWFINALFESDLIDYAICPSPTKNNDRMFRFCLIHNPEELIKTAGSKYYPIEISDALESILKASEDKRYAIIGVPCLLHGIRLAMQAMPKLRRRVKFLLGITCGQLPNRFYSEILSLKSGVLLDSLETISYRSKEDTNSANDYFFIPFDKSGNRGKKISWSSYPKFLWLNSYFIHNACKYCDDVFAEEADITFMDAWLPEYQDDPKGHSIVISRSQSAQAIIKNGIKDRSCIMNPISMDKVIRSQMGAIINKKHTIQGRLYFASLRNEYVPHKRVNADAGTFYRNFARIILEKKIMEKSKEIWANKPINYPLTYFEAKMSLLKLSSKCISYVEKTCRRLRRSFR